MFPLKNLACKGLKDANYIAAADYYKYLPIAVISTLTMFTHTSIIE